jgi:hypothetical protein
MIGRKVACSMGHCSSYELVTTPKVVNPGPGVCGMALLNWAQAAIKKLLHSQIR